MRNIFSNYVILNDGDEWVIIKKDNNSCVGKYEKYEDALYSWSNLDRYNPHDQLKSPIN